MHSELVGVEFVLRDFTVVGPEVSEEGQTRDVTISKGGIVEVLDVVVSDGVDDLSAESFVDFVVGAEDGAGGGVEAVEFSNLMRGEARRMFDDGSRVVGGKERDGGENRVFGGGKGEGDVAMEAVTAVGGDGCGICVELGLSGAEGGVGWRVGGG